MRSLNKLSARAIATARKSGLHGDGGGLYLQVGDTNGSITKSWVFRFMLDRRARKMGLGSIATFTLAEARERARIARQQLADGVDPIEARRAERDDRRRDEGGQITFTDAAAKYLAAHTVGWRNSKHREQWRSTLEKYAIPTLGARPIKAIDAALINAARVVVWAKTPETAQRVRQRIERIIRWVKEGMTLPAASKTKRVRHHAAMPWKELPEFMADLRQRDSISARALEFTILCAARTGETIGATWAELDLGTKTWTVAGERMKAGREHRVPMTDRALEILRALPREKASPYVFPGGQAKLPLSNMAMLALLKGLRPDLTVHGFRSAFKDWASESTSHANIVSEAALAHTISDKVEKAYRRGELFEKRKRLMRDWAAYCALPAIATKTSNVTPIRSRTKPAAA